MPNYFEFGPAVQEEMLFNIFFLFSAPMAFLFDKVAPFG